MNGQQLIHQEHQETTSLPYILKELKKQKNISFLYEPETIATIKIQTAFSYKEEVKDILRKILPPVHLKFKKVGRKNYIIKKRKLKRKDYLSRLNKRPSPSIQKKKIKNLIPARTLSGTIIDETGLPLIGASILVAKNQKGTVTNEYGQFQLALPEGKHILHISYLGYEETLLEIGYQKTIYIDLNPSKNFLNEVVVSALGFVQEKDKLATSNSIIKKEAIVLSGEVSLLNAMAGKAANVQISRTNGDPGAASNFRIRGANTITGVSNPLIILDGIPISNATIYGGGNNLTGGQSGGVSQQNRLGDLNPNNIETIQVLKSASAAAFWGSRAANGVVVLTSKRGKEGQIKINYKSTFSIDEINEQLSLQTDWGQGINGEYYSNASESWGDYIPERSGKTDEIATNSGYFEASDGTLYFPITQKNSKTIFTQKNWEQVIQKGGFIQHDLSISGGNKKATFFLNFGRLDQEGIIKNSDYKRTNLRLNNNFQLTKWLSLSSKASYTNINSNRIQQSSTTTGLLVGLLRTPADFDNTHYIGTYHNGQDGLFLNRHRSYRRPLGEALNPSYNNPNWSIHQQSAQSKVNRFIFSSEVLVSPTDWLTFTLQGGIDKAQDHRIYKFPTGSAGTRAPGIYAKDFIDQQEINLDAIGKAHFSLGDNITLTPTLGWNINDRRRKISSSKITGLLLQSAQETTILNAANNKSIINQRERYIRSNRGYGILSTSIYEQLFISASGGLEAASSINGIFFYPAIDASWQFTKNIISAPWITFGKLRASWGKVGIQPMPHRFETLAESSFSYSTYSDRLDSNLWGGGFRVDDDQGNPNLKPEIKTEWEVGIDARIFKDKLSFSATYYRNKIDDLLFNVKLSPSSGFDTKYANAGSMENRGFESELTYAILKKEDWQLGIYSNFSKNENKVLTLKGTTTIDLTGEAVSSRAVVGYPLGVLYGTGSQTDEEGRFILNELGFPKLTTSPIVLGNPNPDWRSGFGIQANWKKLALHVLIEHSHGGDFSPRTKWVLNRFGTTKETANRITLQENTVNYEGQIISAGTTVRGNIKDFGSGQVLLDESWYRTGIGGGFGPNQAYNFSIEDATYTRLREVSLSYTIDNTYFKKKTKLSSITIIATGRNLILWDKIEGVDPEINQVGVSNGFGLDYFTNPSTRSFLFSVLVSY